MPAPKKRRKTTKKKSTKVFPQKRTIADLSPTQVEAAELLSRGIALPVIAGRVGITQRDLDRWIVNPKFEVAIALFREGAVEHVIQQRGAQEILDLASPRASEVVVEVMEQTEKESLRLQAAESVLDRTGHGKRLEVKQTIITLNAEAVALIEETRRMAERIPEATFEEVTDDLDGTGQSRGPGRIGGAERGGSGGERDTGLDGKGNEGAS